MWHTRTHTKLVQEVLSSLYLYLFLLTFTPFHPLNSRFDRKGKQMHSRIFVFILLLFLFSNSFALDSLEVVTTFEMPEDSVTFSLPQYGGDLNHDGYNDLIHPYNNRFTGEQKLQFYFGSSNPVPIPDWEFEIASYLVGWPSWSGDLNNDGYKDLVLNATYGWPFCYNIYIFFGSDDFKFDPNSPDMILYGENYSGGAQYSGSNRNVDFNGDGYSDIIASSNGPEMSFNGQVDLFFGGESIDTTPDFHIQGAIGDEFGQYKTVGDINGDGCDDLIVSRNINRYEDPFEYEIYLGGTAMDTVADLRIDGLFYSSLASTIVDGDINGDDLDDLIISGGIIYLGKENANLIESYELPLNSYPSNIFYCNINNDEYSDIVVSVRTENKVYIYYGSEAFDTEPDIVLDGDNPEGYFGEYGCNLGDYNGDGKNEIIINNGRPFNIAKVYTLADGTGVDDNTNHGNADRKNSNLVISNCPNPFTNNTFISFFIRNTTSVQFDIYNILGQKVKSFYNQTMEGGDYSINWDGKDHNGHSLPNGLYVARVRTDNGTHFKKIMKVGQ